MVKLKSTVIGVHPFITHKQDEGKDIMRFLEYQAKAVFKDAHIPVPESELATSPEQARQIAERFGGKVVVKAQVPIGGRGKAGGIAVVDGPDEAAKEAERILALTI